MRTRAALLEAHGIDPATVTPYSDAQLETDATSGGYAFLDEQGRVLVLGYDGSWSTSIGEPDEVIRRWLLESRHRNRRLALTDLGVWQQAAVVAVQDGVTVAELRSGLDEEDTDYAEFLAIMLRRSPADPLRTLAASGHLLAGPEPRRYTHPCPLCDRPAVHADRYPRAVCDACHSRTTDSTGRGVSGANVSLSGGFVAHFAGTQEICAEVTATQRCWIDGVPCSIREARFGGVVVEVL